MFVLLSRTQAGPGRTVKQEWEEISRNHVQTFISPSVLLQINDLLGGVSKKGIIRTEYLVEVGPAEDLPELVLGERVVAGGGEAEAQLLLRQAVLVADVELLEGLAERVLRLYRTTRII